MVPRGCECDEGGREANGRTRVEVLAVTGNAGCLNSSGTPTRHCLSRSYLESALNPTSNGAYKFTDNPLRSQ